MRVNEDGNENKALVLLCKMADRQSALIMLSNYLNYTNNPPSNMFYIVNLN